MLIGIALFILAVAAFAWACVEYARSSWRLNYDVMGASIVFTFFWLIGAILLSSAIVLAMLMTFPWAVGTFIATVVVGKVVEWFVIEPVLKRVFSTYRRQEQ